MQPSSRAASKFTTQANPTKRREREEMIFRTMRLLEHASACNNVDCTSKGCLKVKKLHAHARSCKQKVSGSCALCKHMWCLLNLHAKQCTKSECPVPRCQCAPLPLGVVCVLQCGRQCSKLFYTCTLRVAASTRDQVACICT